MTGTPQTDSKPIPPHHVVLLASAVVAVTMPGARVVSVAEAAGSRVPKPTKNAARKPRRQRDRRKR